MKQKLGKKVVTLGRDTAKLDPFENYLHLSRIASLRNGGRRIGAYLLQRSKNSYQVVFGFSCRGVHTTLRDEQIDPIFDNLESGLKDMPENELMTIHLGSFSSDQARQDELDALIARAPTPELQLLLFGEKARIRELTQRGARKPKFLDIYVTCTFDSDIDGGDWIEKAISYLESWFQKLTGQSEEAERLALGEMLGRAFEGFQAFERLLTNKMGLNVTALDEVGLWQRAWRRFNSSPAPQIPQVLVFNDQEGVIEEVHSDWHVTTRLLDSGSPQADRSFVKVGDSHIGVLNFWEKPGGWSNKFSQLRYLWDVIAKDEVYDTEITAQISKANPRLVQSAVQLVMKQSITATGVSERNNSIDVAANLKVKKAVKAQEDIFEGAVPLYVALSVAVHRPTLRQLDDACREMESYIKRPAVLRRETEYAWKTWLQQTLLTTERLLNVPFERRQLHISGEVPGMVPLVCTNPGDKRGFELIADEGGNPLFLDLFTQHRNLGLFATTRAGKSVLVSGILTQALALGIPVVALDFPKPDGTSTFTDYTHFLKGSYFDIGKEHNNLFELPDLRQYNQKDREDRLQDYIAFLESALLTMVISDSNDKLLEQTIRSILVLALKAFFDDPEIISRYDRAIAGGFGSTDWSTCPTLHDYIHYCTPERIDLRSLEGDLKTAFDRIRLRLKFWMTSRVGQAISSPSSFLTDSPLLVFALRNLNNDEDAAILALSAYAAALRRALSYPVSIFFIDEAPILFEFETIANLIARVCANGAKAGIRVIISGQDPDTIAKAKSSPKIFQNLSTKLIGRIQPAAVASFERIMQYPREVISCNSTESFFPKKENLYSQWLLDDNGKFTLCRYYPAYVLLATVANNTDEQFARSKFLEAYKDKFEAMTLFADHYQACIRDSRPLFDTETIKLSTQEHTHVQVQPPPPQNLPPILGTGSHSDRSVA